MEFYDDYLKDGDDVKLQKVGEWHRYRYFDPFSFFDIQEGEEAEPSGSGSWINVEEVDFVLLMYQKLVTLSPIINKSSSYINVLKRLLVFQLRK